MTRPRSGPICLGRSDELAPTRRLGPPHRPVSGSGSRATCRDCPLGVRGPGFYPAFSTIGSRSGSNYPVSRRQCRCGGDCRSGPGLDGPLNGRPPDRHRGRRGGRAGPRLRRALPSVSGPRNSGGSRPEDPDQRPVRRGALAGHGSLDHALEPVAGSEPATTDYLGPGKRLRHMDFRAVARCSPVGPALGIQVPCINPNPGIALQATLKPGV